MSMKNKIVGNLSFRSILMLGM